MATIPDLERVSRIRQVDRAEGDATIAGDAEAFSAALGDLIRVVQFRDRDRACCHDLSVTQCYALEGIVERGGLTVNELAAYLYLDKSTVSRVARGLVERGLVSREADRTDGRIVRLEATGRGRSIHGAIARDLVREYEKLLEDLSPEVRESVVRVVERLGRAFSARVEVTGGSCCVVE
jgi:MarR family transcriptional regulator, 2-MHQ and catechol-resistance regulon repressor